MSIIKAIIAELKEQKAGIKVVVDNGEVSTKTAQVIYNGCEIFIYLDKQDIYILYRHNINNDAKSLSFDLNDPNTDVVEEIKAMFGPPQNLWRRNTFFSTR